MKTWLRTKYDQLVHKVKLWIYKWCLLTLKKLRIYHTTDIIAKANSNSGFWWNDRFILKIAPVQGNMYKVLYCLPGVAVAGAVVDMDDLITGTAELPLDGNGKNIASIVQYVKEAETRRIWGGISAIGTIGFPPSDEPMEKLYTSGRQHEALKQEIRMEYQEKLRQEEIRQREG